MGRLSFKNFGYVAKKSDNFTISSSRFFHQKKYEKAIFIDIQNKLSIKSNDKILDIGCNVGTHLIPLYLITQKVYGIDHRNCILTLKKRLPEIPPKNLIPGNFLDLKIKQKFTKILCYSVIHYLKNEKEILLFLNKIMQLLNKGGIALIGDIPNKNLENNFFSSTKGKKWLKNFNNQRSIFKNKLKYESISDYLKFKKKDDHRVCIDNNLIKKIIFKAKKRSRKVKRFKHQSNFIFGPTREDIVIYK